MIPKLNTMTFELTIPSTKKTIKYRPFLVGEEKILLMALQSEDTNVYASSLKDIIERCTEGKVDVTKLTSFDIEYIWLKLRAKSKGDIVPIMFTCNNLKEDGTVCTKTIKVPVNLGDIELTETPGHSRNIRLSDEVSVTMRYPSYDEIKRIISSNGSIEDSMDIIASCIDVISHGEDVYEAKNFSKKEIGEFLESLNEGQFALIGNFFDTMPRLEKEIQFSCECSKEKRKVVLKGLDDFFA